MHSRTIRTACVFIAIVGVAALSGCSGKIALSGKVSVKGKPLESGSVIIKDSSGEARVFPIANGEYTATDLKAGLLKFAVVAGETEGGSPPVIGEGQNPRDIKRKITEKAAAKWDSTAQPVAIIPPEYQNVDTSPLTHNTSAGKNKDIDIP